MADVKKYYYMRLKENFFDQDEMKVVESLPDGYLYSNILLKMYLSSLKNDGKLMLNQFIPYNAEMIASVTRHSVGTVEKALTLFERLGLIEVMDNGAIYMLNIQNYIGKSTNEADRKREFDRRIANERRNVGEISEKCTPEIEIEKELKIETKKEIETEKVDYQKVVDLFNETCVSFPKLRALSDARKKAIKARLRTYTLEDFEEVFRKAEASSFLKGGNGRDWSANFDWLMKDGNFAKVLDGNYDDKPKQGGTNQISRAAQELNSFYTMAQDWANSENKEERS